MEKSVTKELFHYTERGVPKHNGGGVVHCVEKPILMKGPSQISPSKIGHQGGWKTNRRGGVLYVSHVEMKRASRVKGAILVINGERVFPLIGNSR